MKRLAPWENLKENFNFQPSKWAFNAHFFWNPPPPNYSVIKEIFHDSITHNRGFLSVRGRPPLTALHALIEVFVASAVSSGANDLNFWLLLSPCGPLSPSTSVPNMKKKLAFFRESNPWINSMVSKFLLVVFFQLGVWMGWVGGGDLFTLASKWHLCKFIQDGLLTEVCAAPRPTFLQSDRSSGSIKLRERMWCQVFKYVSPRSERNTQLAV